jgi:hypothetical protein
MEAGCRKREIAISSFDLKPAFGVADSRSKENAPELR